MNEINLLIQTTQNLIHRMDEIILADKRLSEKIRMQLEIASWDVMKSMNDLNSIKHYIYGEYNAL